MYNKELHKFHSSYKPTIIMEIKTTRLTLEGNVMNVLNSCTIFDTKTQRKIPFGTGRIIHNDS
jgi:hypothetical protein